MKQKNYYNKKKIMIIWAIIIILVIILLIAFKIVKENKNYPKKLNGNHINNNNINDMITKDNTLIENRIENELSSNENTIKEVEENWKMEDDEYFRDAVFIGDSRTEGFILNNGLTAKVKSFTHKGLTVDTIFTDKIINLNGNKVSIIDALKETSFSKVYIMLGINETGWIYSDLFIDKYKKVIDAVKDINPKCTIYIESIIPVTEKVSNEHQYINNAKIKEYNSLIKEMAKEKGAYYLNVQEALVNANEVLPDEAATDGIHLNRKYCEKWMEYLKNHTIGERK